MGMRTLVEEAREFLWDRRGLEGHVIGFGNKAEFLAMVFGA